jgi:hypothetical protein
LLLYAIVGKSSAVLPTEWERDDRDYRVARDWKTVSIANVVEFIEIN